jgi:CubicO group peptidase (beta-lactamase class C family)
MRDVFVALLFCTMLAVLPASAQNPANSTNPQLPMGRAEDVGMSTERLGRMKVAMQGYVDRGEVPGVVTLIARRGRVVHLETVGYRYVETKAGMTVDTIFRLASMTKPIVSVAAMALYEEGKFQLTDPVSKWIPEFANMRVIEFQGSGFRTVPAKTPITMRHVLTQTAGLANGDGVLASDYQKIAPRIAPNDTLGDLVRRLAGLPLNFEPGTRWEYGPSGIATNVVGRVVEILSGKRLDEFVSERVFRPLQMNDTHWYLPQAKLPRFAATYRPDANKKIVLEDAPTVESPYLKQPQTYLSANGGLVGTVADYFRFAQMMLNGGQLNGARILGRKTAELATSNHSGMLRNAVAAGNGFGLGYNVVLDVGATGMPGSIGNYGWGGAFCTVFFIDPVEDLIGIMMSQLRPNDHSNIRRDFQSLAYQAIVDGGPSTTKSSN